MKKLFLIFAVLTTTSLFIIAQAPEKHREIGLTFTDLNDFGMCFKTGTDNSLWRIRAFGISGSNNPTKLDSLEISDNRMGFSFYLGKEYRKNINTDLSFVYGAELAFRYSNSKRTRDDLSFTNNDQLTKNNQISPGINLIIGLNYQINEKFSISAEILPDINYSVSVNTSESTLNPASNLKTTSRNLGWGLSSNSAQLTLAYNF